MTYRCPECRTRRATAFSMMMHIKTKKHKPCLCGGYHYPHRPGSPCCVSNPWAEYYDAERRGYSAEVLETISQWVLQKLVDRKNQSKTVVK